MDDVSGRTEALASRPTIPLLLIICAEIMDTAIQPYEHQSRHERILFSKFAANAIRIPRMTDIWIIVCKCISSVEDIGKVVAGETVVCPHSAQSARKIVRGTVRGRHQSALGK